MSNQEHPEVGQQEKAALAAEKAAAEKKTDAATPAPADETVDLRKQIHEAEDKLAQAEIAKAKLQGEAKDREAVEADLRKQAAEAKIAVDNAKAAADQAKAEAEKAKAEADKRPQTATAATSNLTVPVSVEPVHFRMGVVEDQKAGRGSQGGDGQPYSAGACGPCSVTQTVTTGNHTAVVLGVLGAILLIALALIWYFASGTGKSQPAPAAPKAPAIYEYKNGKLDRIGGMIWKLVGGTAFAEEVKVVKVEEPGVVLIHDKSDDLAKTEAVLQKAEAEKTAVEKELADAQAKVAELHAKASASSQQKQGALAKAKALQKRLAEVEEELAKAEMVIGRLEIKEMKDLNVRLFLDKAYSMPPISTKYYEGLFPGESTAAGLVRAIHQGVKCPEGFAPDFQQLGTTVFFSCNPALLPPPLLKNRKGEATSKYLTCLPWAAVGMAGGGAGNYGAVRMFDREADGRIAVATGVAGGAALAYGICLLASE